ncbi:MAG: hypothetical protein ACM3S5_09705 [Rhodospirillales bacterium]
MSDHFVPLNCSNCGAKLDIYDDMDHFACGYCGTQLVVRRRGGTVSLRAVEQAIERVRVGTDKTAAELAIVRLEKEREQLKKAYEQSNTTWGCLGAIFGLVPFVLGLSLLGSGSGGGKVVGLLLFVLSMVFVVKGLSSRDETIAARLRETEKRLAEQKRIANS